MRHLAVIFLTGLALITAGTAYADAGDSSRTTQICESARLRSVERADCHAQMKRASSDEQRRAIQQAFEIRVNGGAFFVEPTADEPRTTQQSSTPMRSRGKAY